MNRREFLHTVGGVAVVGSLGAAPLDAAGDQPGPVPARRPRVAVLWEPSLAPVDTAVVPEPVLRSALADCDAAWLPATDLAVQLSRDRFDVLVLTAGSAFPKPAWPAIHAFLRSGGNLVNLGGAPFAVPAVLDDAGWRHEVRQTTFHRRLGITQAYPVDIPAGSEVSAAPSHAWASSLRRDYRDAPASRAWALCARLTWSKLFPDEDGSEGPHEAVIDGLLYASGRQSARDPHGDYPFAALAVLVDRLSGDFAGGRWIFVTANRAPHAEAIRDLVAAASIGCHRLQMRPAKPVVEPGQPLAFIVSYLRPGVEASAPIRIDGTVRLRSGPANQPAIERPILIAGQGPVVDVTVSVPVDGAPAPRYVPAAVSIGAAGGSGFVRLETQAFSGCWVRASGLLEIGEAIVTSVAKGRGRILWSPVPAEVSDETAPTAALYRMALREAGVTSSFTTDASSSILVYPARYARHTLYTIVSDTSRDARVHVTDVETGTMHEAMVAGGRAALILIDRQTGAETARYPTR